MVNHKLSPTRRQAHDKGVQNVPNTNGKCTSTSCISNCKPILIGSFLFPFHCEHTFFINSIMIIHLATKTRYATKKKKVCSILLEWKQFTQNSRLKRHQIKSDPHFQDHMTSYVSKKLICCVPWRSFRIKCLRLTLKHYNGMTVKNASNTVRTQLCTDLNHKPWFQKRFPSLCYLWA